VWRFQSEEQIAYKFDEVMSHEALLIGRTTTSRSQRRGPSGEGAFADQMNAMPKYVASTTMTTADWNNSTVIAGDVAENVAKLKADLAGDLLVAGSRTLVTTLRRADWVDEYRLMVFPIILGSGMRLWDEQPEASELELVDSLTFDSGTTAADLPPALTHVPSCHRCGGPVDDVFRALADPTRRRVLERLGRRPRRSPSWPSPSGWPCPRSCSTSRCSETCGLVRSEKKGRGAHLPARAARLGLAEGQLAEQREIWARRLDQLDDYLLDLEGAATVNPTARPHGVHTDPKLDLVLQREVDVPAELVWTAWTEPEHLVQLVRSPAVDDRVVRDRPPTRRRLPR
jgi:dihydrofolate reductase